MLIAAYVTFFKATKGGLTIESSGGGNIGGTSDISIPEEMKALTDLYRVINLVQRRYIDASRINPEEMFVGAMRAVQLSIARAMVSKEKETLVLKMGTAAKQFALKDIKTPWILLQRTKDAFSFIKEHATDDLDLQKIEYDAVNGMLKTLDPHSIFLNPDQYREMQDKTHGNFAGLGIVISIRDGVLTIVSPMDGTPADAAGLTAGDQIVKIDEVSTVNMPLNDAVDLLRGEPGTPVTVHILRKGWAEPKPFKIIRAVVKVDSLDTHLLPGRTGYVRIKDFQGNTAQDLLSILLKWRKKNIKGLVLDLRGCPGGLLEAAVEVSDLFLKKGVIVTTAGQDPRDREIRRATKSGMEPDYPLVVVVDQGSASASEILAGALKNNDRALVIGERTFGKGSVQVLFEFSETSMPGATTALKLTTAQYLTPGDVSIQSVGVVPHVEVRPMRADKEMINLKVEGGYRESDLSRHIETASSSAAKTDEPLISFSYLWSPPKSDNSNADDKPSKKEDAEAATSLISDKDKPFEPDFVARLAGDIALALDRAKAEDVLPAVSSLSNFFADKQAREEKRLTAALRKLSIDWQAPKGPSAAAAVSSATIHINEDAPLEAGKEAVLELSVTNQGPGTVYRLAAESQSDFRPLDDRELAFGKVAPGETVTRRYSFRIPKDALAEVNDVRWSFSAQGATPPSPVAVRFQTAPLSRPHFGYKWRIDDTQTGNGDAKVQVGESVKLIAEVHNLGKGPSLSTYATLKSLDGKEIFLIRGREVLDTIEPTAEKDAVFSFEVKPEFSDSTARFELAFADVELREYLIEKLSVPVYPANAPAETAPAEKPEDKNSVINSAPLLEVEKISHVTKSDIIKIKGRAQDETRVRDVYIFVDNDKRFYADNSDTDHPKDIAFEAELPLRNGINYITVVAREDADLETRKIIAVRRDRADNMPYLLSRSLNVDNEAELLDVLPVNISRFTAASLPDATARSIHP